VVEDGLPEVPDMRVGLVPAAGQGLRTGYLGHLLPKCLLPVFDRPIIHRVIDNMAEMGVEDVHVMTYWHDAAIRSYIGEMRAELPCEVHVHKLPNQTAGINETILAGARHIGQEDFVLMQGDDVTIGADLDGLVERFYATEATALEAVVKGGDIRRACEVAVGDDGMITDIVEKPTVLTTGIRGCGIYCFRPEVFDVMRRQHDLEITTTMKVLSATGRAYACFLGGYNINVNTPYDLMEAGYIAYQDSLP
jgi:glucose-1-phosphate thymidylyltransferase